jgi:hypothetical protein
MLQRLLVLHTAKLKRTIENAAQNEEFCARGRFAENGRGRFSEQLAKKPGK